MQMIKFFLLKENVRGRKTQIKLNVGTHHLQETYLNIMTPKYGRDDRKGVVGKY